MANVRFTCALESMCSWLYILISRLVSASRAGGEAARQPWCEDEAEASGKVDVEAIAVPLRGGVYWGCQGSAGCAVTAECTCCGGEGKNWGWEKVTEALKPGYAIVGIAPAGMMGCVHAIA